MDKIVKRKCSTPFVQGSTWKLIQQNMSIFEIVYTVELEIRDRLENEQWQTGNTWSRVFWLVGLGFYLFVSTTG